MDGEPPVKPWFAATGKLNLLQQGRGHVLIVGAGIAGCCTARGLVDRGFDVTILEAGPTVASGASGNTAAILKPHVSRQPNAVSSFFIRSFEAARQQILQQQLSGQAIDFQFDGVLQLLRRAENYPQEDCYQFVNRRKASEIAGQSLPASALFFNNAGWINAAQFCASLARHPKIKLILDSPIVSLEFAKDLQLWTLTDRNGTRFQSHCVVLANGVGLTSFSQTSELPIIPARGQITRVALNSHSQVNIPLVAKHYLIPAHDSIHIGATFRRDESGSSLQAADTLANIAGAQALLNCTRDALHVNGAWASTRATTPDRLPLVGAMPRLDRYRELYKDLHHGRAHNNYPPAEYWPGLYINGGYGSRGTSCMSLCAALVVSQIDNDSLECSQQNRLDVEMLHPARFLIRELRKSRHNKQ